MLSDAELDKGMQVMKYIWLAMLASLGVYILLALQIVDTIPEAIGADLFDIIRAIFYLLAFITLAATPYIRRRILLRPDKSGQPDQPFQNPLLQNYLIAMMTSLALSEFVGVCGFVLFLLGKNSSDIFLLILLSAGAMVYYRPQREELLTLVQEAQNRAALSGDAVL